MAKGKSNPKTVERVKGMTKAMRNEMERAEAEAAATEATARSAKEKKRGRRRGDASSDEDEGEGVNTENATSSATQHKHAKGNKVQIGGFGIGCRGTGNDKARRLKEEHDEKTRKKKATRARVAAERAARDEKEDERKEEEEGDDESWRIRNPTVNKRANRGKKEKKKKKEKDEGGFLGAGDDDGDDDDFAKIERTLLEDAATPENDEIDDEIDDEIADEDVFRLASLSKGAGGAVRAAAASAFSLLRGDDDDDDDDDDDEDANETTPAADDEDADSDDSDDGSETRNLTDDDDTAIPGEPIHSIDDQSDGRGVAPARENAGSIASETNASSSSSDWETDEEKDVSGIAPNPLVSLFDAHVSETVAENLEYMRRAHGFVVPYANSLADPEGFVAYLRKKIVRRRQCLFCRRRFATLEGVRGHMRDAGHVRVRFEPPAVFRGNPLFDEAIARANADGYRPEYAEFYDFGDAPSHATKRETDDVRSDDDDSSSPSAGLFDARGVGGGLELVLRDSRGRTKQLGHRSFRRYYKQKFRNDYVARGCAADERRVAAAAPAARLAERERNKQTNAIATRSMRYALRGSSKALAAQFTTKAQFADNAARRAVVHHWGAGGGGSHYHTAGSKQFLKGVRVKGVVSRHSKQGAKMQAARVQAARNKQNRGNASVAVLRSGTRKG